MGNDPEGTSYIFATATVISDVIYDGMGQIYTVYKYIRFQLYRVDDNFHFYLSEYVHLTVVAPVVISEQISVKTFK